MDMERSLVQTHPTGKQESRGSHPRGCAATGYTERLPQRMLKPRLSCIFSFSALVLYLQLQTDRQTVSSSAVEVHIPVLESDLPVLVAIMSFFLLRTFATALCLEQCSPALDYRVRGTANQTSHHLLANGWAGDPS